MSLLTRTAPFVEIHPTARCNLKCGWCSYAGCDRTRHLRLGDLACLRELAPEEILIAGGGEPTLFHDDGCGFDAMIRRIREMAPGSRLRLITNGVIIPPGSWRDELSEASVSLDAAEAQVYRRYKGTDAFDTVMSNIVDYLTAPGVPKVRVTFLYDRRRLEAAMRLARRLWRLWRELKIAGRVSREKARLFAFMIFPLANDQSPDRPYEDARLTPVERQSWLGELAGLRTGKPDFWRFVRAHTNLATQPLASLDVPPARRCTSVANYVLLGADGQFYPCFRMCALRRGHDLGPAGQGAESLMRARATHMRSPPEVCGLGCRPGSTFYGLRSAARFADQFRMVMLKRWDAMVNADLAARVGRLGVEEALIGPDASEAPGIVWFGERIRHKVLGSSTDVEHAGPSVPSTGGYIVQYNESRGWPHRQDASWRPATADGPRGDCPFCGVSDDFVMADLEDSFGIPYTLVADFRPFFPHHMLAIGKTHAGGMTFAGFRDLVWLHNTVFPHMKANIGTGNQADHLHAHLFEADLPIERWQRRQIGRDGQVAISRLANDLRLTYFVLESPEAESLARAAYTLLRRIEQQGLMVCVLLAAKSVYLIPQTKRTIGRRFSYPPALDSFKDAPARPAGLRPRFVGPIEMAGVFLCYARGDVPAMRRMYQALNLPTYRHILLEVGLPQSSAQARRLVHGCRGICQSSPRLVSTLSPMSSEPGIVGGKAAGIHDLHEFCRRWDGQLADAGTVNGDSPAPLVPEGLVIPTSVFEQTVRASPGLRASLKAMRRLLGRAGQAKGPLDAVLADRIAAAGRAMRETVEAVDIPAELANRLNHALRALGGNLAVRSSATIEDQARHSGAGLARTVLHVRTAAALRDAVTAVWASLYGEGFIQECRRLGQSISRAAMAVVLQPMVKPRAAGVVTSLDARGRPVFSISACPGLGQSVVDGGAADGWLVSPDAQHILERRDSRPGQPCMRDSDILALARVCRRVQMAWQEAGRGEHVDIEFALDRHGRIVLLQCRPLTAVPDGETMQLHMVDGSAVDAAVDVVTLNGLCAFEGAAIGRLNVLQGDDEPALRARVRAGDIVVAQRTTCRWNEAMEGVAGLITEEGSTVSHPAIHARERRLPAVIGVRGALALLAPHHGRTVTLDSGSKTVYLAIVPITKAVRLGGPWLATGSGMSAPVDSGPQTGLMEDFEGSWRPRPAVPYCPFQLDYYTRAFTWYPDWLRRLPWPSGGIRPSTGSNVIKIRHGLLYVKEQPDTAPERDFMRRLSLEDFEFLVERRWQVLERTGAFLENLAALDADNVGDAVGALVELLGVNSMGYELRTAFEEVHLSRHARHVRAAWLPQMMEAALACTQRARPDLDLQRREALSELASIVAADRDAAERLTQMRDELPPMRAIEAFRAAQPGVYERVARLAGRYNLDTEDLRSVADPAKWLVLLRKMVRAVQSQGPDGRQDPPAGGRSGNEAPGPALQVARRALADYPTLRRVLAVARSEELFRSNFHHLIVRYQGKVAAAMLQAGAKCRGVLRHPEDVFEIGLEETVALLRDPAPAYIGRTPERNRALSDADDALHDLWPNSPGRAVEAFRRGTASVRAILRAQAQAAHYPGVIRHYLQTIRDLRRRMRRLEAMAGGGQAKPRPELAAACRANHE